MIHQATLTQPIAFSGKGLHTGLMIHMNLLPAAEESGVRICRTDLPDQPCHQALACYVTDTARGTVLEDGAWKVSTVEHLLSALYALGITNCLIEVDGPEVPILDGSAKPYVDAILKTGITEQAALANVWEVTEPIDYTAKNGTTYHIEPATETQAQVEICFPGNILHDQKATLDHLADYGAEVSYARTFCFVREIQMLLQMGLIKGGDLENALVIYEQPIPQKAMDALTDMLGQPRQDASRLGYLQPLHFENEPARHKLLDMLGDLSLLGVRILGRVSAVRPGHGANTELAKWLAQSVIR